ncbi:Catechol 2,3-dioxygenase [Micromonospora marina]|uniref:Catechol 2,3-dioxygenase n=1 Tax=Micromonospora marina TaxID=307120 RepID=A0A1C4ZG35_9ACTN|nr:Catechol 2,3-dioxygenase [Micromonospora marina]
MMIHHVLLACPRSSEDVSRSFCTGLLGFTEKPNPRPSPPAAVAGSPGMTPNCTWASRTTSARPARKAHPALLRPDLDELAARLDAAGHTVTWGDDEIPGMRRFHTYDPHGNRLEFLAPAG